MENAARNPRPNMFADERMVCIFGIGERRLRTLVPTTGKVDPGEYADEGAILPGNDRVLYDR
jgi:hypothetical protein